MEALRFLSLSSQPLRQLFHLATSNVPATITTSTLYSSIGRTPRNLSFCCGSSTTNVTSSTKQGIRNRRSSSSSAPSSTSDREAIRDIRLKKVEELRSKGIEPYAYSWERTHVASQLHEIYSNLANGEEARSESHHVSVAGRIVARRAFGKLAFFVGPIFNVATLNYEEFTNTNMTREYLSKGMRSK